MRGRRATSEGAAGVTVLVPVAMPVAGESVDGEATREGT